MILWRSWQVPPVCGHRVGHRWLPVHRAPRRQKRRWHLSWYCPAL